MSISPTPPASGHASRRSPSAWATPSFLYLPILVGALLTACPAKSGISRGAKAQAMVKSGALLLDVRTPGEYAGGHLGGAINISVDQLSSRMNELSPDRSVVIYCASGIRSAQGASLLAGKGYKVFDLGSIGEWNR